MMCQSAVNDIYTKIAVLTEQQRIERVQARERKRERDVGIFVAFVFCV